MPHASITVPVDAQLHWVVRVPEVLAGAARASSAAQLARLGAEFDAMQVTPDEAARADIMVGAITRAVLEFLSEPSRTAVHRRAVRRRGWHRLAQARCSAGAGTPGPTPQRRGGGPRRGRELHLGL